mmetsp:Transcript_36098/g.78848  ORF Transcript_36098/g.78848 Transcript_36098/m.78848 type:complete len:154 (-) Transcript_36098:79-540(-)
MGVAPSAPDGCCGRRGGMSLMCRNDRLNAYLHQLDNSKKVFTRAWLFREDVIDFEQYIVYFQGTGLSDENPSARRYLRLDWGRSGLAFMEVESKLSEQLLVRSKTLQPPLAAGDLLRELKKVESLLFDHDTWNSASFCYHILEQAPGTNYEYR